MIQPGRSLTSDQVLDTVQQLAQMRGAPEFMRSDHGPEFIARVIQDGCQRAGVQTAYVDPGSPWQNGWIESFHSRFREECLNRELFFSLAEARVVVEDYRRFYNGDRPHSSLDYKTPDEFAQAVKQESVKIPPPSHPT